MKNLLRNLLKYTVGLPILIICGIVLILFYLGGLTYSLLRIPFRFICFGDTGWDSEEQASRLLMLILLVFNLWRPIR